MSYATDDFTESLNRVGIDPIGIARVIAAWGHGDGMGGNEPQVSGWADASPTDWTGGFLFEMKDGRILYVQGWCDYTGWGCQDGAAVVEYPTVPELSTIKAPDGMYGDPRDWDVEPADLNRWLAKQATEASNGR